MFRSCSTLKKWNTDFLTDLLASLAYGDAGWIE